MCICVIKILFQLLKEFMQINFQYTVNWVYHLRMTLVQPHFLSTDLARANRAMIEMEDMGVSYFVVSDICLT
jgi:hypothetical protein